MEFEEGAHGPTRETEIAATSETLRRTKFLGCIRDVYREGQNVIAKEGDTGDLGRLRVPELT